jgi:hypothetical protein
VPGELFFSDPSFCCCSQQARPLVSTTHAVPCS